MIDPTLPGSTSASDRPVTPVDRTPRKRGPRMDRLAHVRRGLSRVYRDLYEWNAEQLTPEQRIARARAMTATLSALAVVMKGDDLERRLAELEELARGVGRH
jgi:hypothetical protein